MGLLNTISAGVATAFSATDDLEVTAVLTQPSTFDDVTEAETPGASTNVSLRIAKFKAGEVNGVDVQMGDAKALLQGGQANFDPALAQTAFFNSETWTVMHVDNVAGLGMLFILQLRKPK